MNIHLHNGAVLFGYVGPVSTAPNDGCPIAVDIEPLSGWHVTHEGLVSKEGQPIALTTVRHRHDVLFAKWGQESHLVRMQRLGIRVNNITPDEYRDKCARREVAAVAKWVARTALHLAPTAPPEWERQWREAQQLSASYTVPQSLDFYEAWYDYKTRGVQLEDEDKYRREVLLAMLNARPTRKVRYTGDGYFRTLLCGVEGTLLGSVPSHFSTRHWVHFGVSERGHPVRVEASRKLAPHARVGDNVPHGSHPGLDEADTSYEVTAHNLVGLRYPRTGPTYKFWTDEIELP